MHAEIHIFPSVVETAPPVLDLQTSALIDNLVVMDRGQPALVGEIALAEGRSPSRIVNASPDQRDYRVLLKAGILLAAQQGARQLSVGLGFPTAVMRTHADGASAQLSQLESIGFDARPVGGVAHERLPVEIRHASVISEIAACDIALREGPTKASGNHFLISLGYGTCEAAMSTPNGLVQRTTVSLAGVRYAVERAMQDVARSMPLGLRTEHQFDTHFRSGRITVGRERVSLVEVRKRALEAYMENVITPTLTNLWGPEDFDRAEDLYITGGGALYPTLMDAIRTEFGTSLNVHVVPDPLSFASLGYALMAARVDDQSLTCVGIDVGNANTCVCVLER